MQPIAAIVLTTLIVLGNSMPARGQYYAAEAIHVAAVAANEPGVHGASSAGVGRAKAAEPAYPARPVRLVVPYPPGGAADAIARVVSPKLTDAMGQPWVVENRVGATGNIGAELVAHANPDGHTALLALSSTLTVNPSFYKLPFSVEKDLQPVTMLASTDMILVIYPGVPAKTLQELVALAKQKPRSLNYASAGIGSPIHLTTELFKKRAGIDMVHIPYKGGGPAASASMLAGETQVQLVTAATTMSFIISGRLRALATTGAARSKLLPDVPTIAESGYPGFEADQWFALLLPAGTPKNIATRIRDETLKALQQPDVQTALARQGLDAVTSTPGQLAARIKNETEVWAAVIKEAGIRAE